MNSLFPVEIVERPLTHNRVIELFDYDDDTGLLRWKVRIAQRIHIGDVAGSTTGRGYRDVEIEGKTYRLHRVIWFWKTGNWPEHQIDHEDTNKTNNRWKNLRPATNSKNQANVSLKSNNTSGVKGVYRKKWRKKFKWAAIIGVNGKRIHLGYRDTIEEAGELYADAARKHFGEFARCS